MRGFPKIFFLRDSTLKGGARFNIYGLFHGELIIFSSYYHRDRSVTKVRLPKGIEEAPLYSN